MKKINSLGELKERKIQLKKNQDALEHRIKEEWTDLKKELKPSNIALDLASEENMKGNPGNGESIIKKTFVYAINLLAQRFADKAGEKMAGFWKKKRRSCDDNYGRPG